MKRSTSNGILAGIGAAVSAVFLVVIGIGHTRKDLEQSQPVAWEARCSRNEGEGWPTVCAEPGTDREGVELAVSTAHDLRMGYGGPVYRETCPDGDGWIVVRVDPLLNAGSSSGTAMDDDPFLDFEDPGDWGLAKVTHEKEGAPGTVADGHGRERIHRVQIGMHPDAGSTAYVHEITGHGAGFQHPRLAPTGTLMHPSKPGMDLRGMECVGWR